jgi:hypothetical protein
VRPLLLANAVAILTVAMVLRMTPWPSEVPEPRATPTPIPASHGFTPPLPIEPRPHAQPREALVREARRVALDLPERGVVFCSWSLGGTVVYTLDFTAGILRQRMTEEHLGEPTHAEERLRRMTRVELAFAWELVERAWREPTGRVTEVMDSREDLYLLDGDQGFWVSSPALMFDRHWASVLTGFLGVVTERDDPPLERAPRASAPSELPLGAGAPRRGFVVHERHGAYHSDLTVDLDGSSVHVRSIDSSAPKKSRTDDRLSWLTPVDRAYLIELADTARRQPATGERVETNDHDELYILDGQGGFHAGDDELHRVGSLASSLIWVSFLLAPGA